MPFLVFLFILATFVATVQWIEHRRGTELRSFAKARSLFYSNFDWPAGVPYPEATVSLFLNLSSCRHIVSGVYRGRRVLAFDFRVAFGRFRQHGSGVAIDGELLPNALPPLRKMNFERSDPWCFLTTRLSRFSGSQRLNPEDFLRLWNVMIDNAASSPSPPQHFTPQPGEIHIRPRH